MLVLARRRILERRRRRVVLAQGEGLAVHGAVEGHLLHLRVHRAIVHLRPDRSRRGRNRLPVDGHVGFGRRERGVANVGAFGPLHDLRQGGLHNVGTGIGGQTVLEQGGALQGVRERGRSHQIRFRGRRSCGAQREVGRRERGPFVREGAVRGEGGRVVLRLGDGEGVALRREGVGVCDDGAGEVLGADGDVVDLVVGNVAGTEQAARDGRRLLDGRPPGRLDAPAGHLDRGAGAVDAVADARTSVIPDVALA